MTPRGMNPMGDPPADAPAPRLAPRAAEFALLWFAFPALLAWGPIRIQPIPVLWIAAAIGLAALLLDRRFDRRTLINLGGFRSGLPGVLVRAAAVFLALIAVALLSPPFPASNTLPDGTRILSEVPVRLFEFPRERPGLWLAVVALYPILSVAPQTVLYRTLLVHRYAPLFTRRATLILAGGLAFGFAHVLFRNAIAPALTLAGGLVLMAAFTRHRSTPLSWLEHSLYGISVFTVGLGRWFYGGAIE